MTIAHLTSRHLPMLMACRLKTPRAALPGNSTCESQLLLGKHDHIQLQSCQHRRVTCCHSAIALQVCFQRLNGNSGRLKQGVHVLERAVLSVRAQRAGSTDRARTKRHPQQTNAPRTHKPLVEIRLRNCKCIMRMTRKAEKIKSDVATLKGGLIRFDLSNLLLHESTYCHIEFHRQRARRCSCTVLVEPVALTHT